MKQVFISYSHMDRSDCETIAQLMQQTGEFEIWFDRELLPGEKYRHKIVRKIEEADFFLILVSHNSMSSEWVEDEVEYAKDERKKILPIFLEETSLPGEMAMMLRRYHSMFWYLRKSDTEFQENLLRMMGVGKETSQLTGELDTYGDEISEEEASEMKAALEREKKEDYEYCYTPDHAFYLGKAYLLGESVPTDMKKSRYYFKVASYFGNADARFFLLQMRLEELRQESWGNPDLLECRPLVKEIQKIAQEGSIPAKLYLAQMYWYGYCGLPVDPEYSAEIFDECARAGNARAQYMMASNYYYGDGVPVDYDLAIMFANLALSKRYRKAWRRWAIFYLEGKAVSQDFAKAMEYLQTGARNGDFGCWNQIGDIYYYGKGVPTDFEKAVACYRKAEMAPIRGNRFAVKGSKEALGRCYELGNGVPENLEIAAQKYLEGYQAGNEVCKDGYIRCSTARAVSI